MVAKQELSSAITLAWAKNRREKNRNKQVTVIHDDWV